MIYQKGFPRGIGTLFSSIRIYNIVKWIATALSLIHTTYIHM